VLVNVIHDLIETIFKTTPIPTIVVTTAKEEKEERIFPSTVSNLQNRVVIKNSSYRRSGRSIFPACLAKTATPLVISRLSLYPRPPALLLDVLFCLPCIDTFHALSLLVMTDDDHDD
jgi:hypothetical protein